MFEIATTEGAGTVRANASCHAVDGNQGNASGGGESHSWIERTTASRNELDGDIAVILYQEGEVMPCAGRHGGSFRISRGLERDAQCVAELAVEEVDERLLGVRLQLRAARGCSAHRCHLQQLRAHGLEQESALVCWAARRLQRRLHVQQRSVQARQATVESGGGHAGGLCGGLQQSEAHQRAERMAKEGRIRAPRQGRCCTASAAAAAGQPVEVDDGHHSVEAAVLVRGRVQEEGQLVDVQLPTARGISHAPPQQRSQREQLLLALRCHAHAGGDDGAHLLRRRAVARCGTPPLLPALRQQALRRVDVAAVQQTHYQHATQQPTQGGVAHSRHARQEGADEGRQ